MEATRHYRGKVSDNQRQTKMAPNYPNALINGE